MNPKFLSQALPLCKLEFYVLKALRFLLVSPLTSASTCSDQEICRHFHGHSPSTLKGTVWSSLYMENTQNQPNKPSSQRLSNFKSFTQLWNGMAWHAWNVRQTLLIPQCPIVGGAAIPPKQNSASFLEWTSLILYFFCFILIFLVIQAYSWNLLQVCFPLVSNTLFLEWFILKIFPFFSHLPNLGYYFTSRLLLSPN